MLLELQNTTGDNINKLLAFARLNNLNLKIIDDTENNYHLPGKPLTTAELERVINDSRNSGTIDMSQAHQIIRSHIHAD